MWGEELREVTVGKGGVQKVRGVWRGGVDVVSFGWKREKHK